MTQSSRPVNKHLPFILLLLALLAFGLFTFHDYGLAWDEPLFYEYGEALGYAYAPANWFSPDFDLNRAYGPSGDDHKNRGPAYLVLARTPARLLESLGMDKASAWHLVNFLTFLLGVWFVYRLSLRWMSREAWAAFGAAALFSTQPLLLGHAFINPKDMPFLVFFTGALLFGFEMADGIGSKTKNAKRKIWDIVAAAFFLGIATSIRVLAPLAGILVVVYGIVKYYPLRNTQYAIRDLIFHLLSFLLLSLLFMLASWPYLWEAPLKNFVQVFLFMSDNPTGLQVLFGGQIYRAYELPRRYLPTFLALTLTEPVWPLFLLGVGFAIWKTFASIRKNQRSNANAENQPITNYQLPTSDHRSLITDRSFSLITDHSFSLITDHSTLITNYWLLLAAFLIPFAYVLLLRPPMYDGFRHFLFILPPVFVTCGLGLEAIFALFERFKRRQADSESSTFGARPQMDPKRSASGTRPETDSESSTFGARPQMDPQSSASGARPETDSESSTFGARPQMDPKRSASGTRPETDSESSTFGARLQTGAQSVKGRHRIRPSNWLRAIAVFVLLLPGLLGAARLHPYEYAYYNSLVGGTGGAFRLYETDYWLTCYKEAVGQIQPEGRVNLFVRREPYIAAYYAPPGLVIRDYRAEFGQIESGDLVLVNTRTNEDRKTLHDAPVVAQVGRGGAIFCVVKQAP